MNAKVCVQLYRESLLTGYCFHQGVFVRVLEIFPEPDLQRPVVARAVAVKSGNTHEVFEHHDLSIAHPTFTGAPRWEK